MKQSALDPVRTNSLSTPANLCLRVLQAAALSLVWLAGNPGLSAASSIAGISVEEMLDQSELVFEGEVIAHESAFQTAAGSIRTCVVLNVIDVVKGEAPAEPYRLCFTGGRVGEVELIVSGLVIPEDGERGIYFVESVEKRLMNPLFGWDQGRFLVEPLLSRSERRSDRQTHGVLTARGRPVLDLPDPRAPSRRAAMLSNGVAAGIREGSPEERELALSPELFKEKLRALLEADQP